MARQDRFVNLQNRLETLTAHCKNLEEEVKRLHSTKDTNAAQVETFKKLYKKGRKINKHLVNTLKAIYEHDEVLQEKI